MSVSTKAASDRWIPALFLGAFAVLTAVQAGFVTIAVRTDPGVSAPNAYERGLAHNAVLRDAASAAALGWRVDVEHRPAAAPDGRHRGTLVVSVVDADADPLNDLRVSALALRPTRAGIDQRLSFRAVGLGRYVAEYDLPLPGVWELATLLERAGDARQTTTRFSAP